MATVARENAAQVSIERTGPSDRRRFVAPPWLTPAVRVRAFTVVIAAIAAILYLAFVREMLPPQIKFAIPWPLAAVAFFLGETNVVDIHFVRERHSFSLSEVPGVAFLFLAPGLAVVQLLAIEDQLLRIALVPGISIGIGTLVSVSLVYAGVFSSGLALALLEGFTLAALPAAVVRRVGLTSAGDVAS